MSNRKRWKIFVPTIALAGALLAASILLLQTATAQDPSAAPPPASIPATEIPFFAQWVRSPHANRAADAFTHWNKEGAIPVECAKCHSAPGFQDFLGADGTPPGVVDHPAPTGTVITCITCHNSKTSELASVVFPSGLKADNLGANAICMTCHQGVEATASVTKAVAGIADDAVETKLQFINVHYAAAGATIMGTLSRVAYEYSGKSYAGRLVHAAPYTGCTACHEVHAAAVKVDACAACHKEVTDKASLHRIRVNKADYDGSGDPNEGMADEIQHMSDRLYSVIQAYAKSVAGQAIVYDANVYPYFFVDTNSNGIADKDETRFPNQYKSWTPRLLKAAYNFQFVKKDPGAFAHNPTYVLQILYDSIADIGTKIPVDLARAKRP
jgi:hypothetical protein